MKKAFLGCLGATGLFVLGASLLVWFCLFRELPTLEATLSVPAEAALESFLDMVVTVTNPHEMAVTLDSIDIDASFLAGFKVVSIDPEPNNTMNLPIINQRSWGFDLEVQPDETHRVTFRLKAVMEGYFSGDVDVCNPNQNFKTLLADVVVKKELSD